MGRRLPRRPSAQAAPRGLHVSAGPPAFWDHHARSRGTWLVLGNIPAVRASATCGGGCVSHTTVPAGGLSGGLVPYGRHQPISPAPARRECLHAAFVALLPRIEQTARIYFWRIGCP